MNLEWKPVLEAGVTLDGTWISYEILGELQDRPQNTDVTFQDPLLVRPDEKRALVARGLAQEQTRGGVYAGPGLATFLDALVITPKPAIPEPRAWLYGLTADEWLHVASEGDESEVQPCCGNLGQLRDLLRSLATFQSPDDTGWQLSIGQHILENLEGDGDGHNLGSREQFPLLHRVLDGIRAQQADPNPFGLVARGMADEGRNAEEVQEYTQQLAEMANTEDQEEC
jgi:hypothetical protein